MKLKFLLVVFTTVHLLSYSQQTQLKVSESVEFKDKVRAGGVLAMHTTEAGETAIIRTSKKYILFDVFDENQNKIFTKQIESDKKEIYKSDVYFGDEIKFFTLYSPKRKERIIYCHTFNITNKTHSKKQLFQKTIEKNFGLFGSGNRRQTSFAISPNGEYISMATDNVKKNSNSYTVHVYDAESLKLVYKKSYQEHSERYFEPNDIAVDDNGTVFTLGKLFFKGKSQKRKGEANYKFVLNKISKSKVEDLDLTLKENHISSLTISNRAENLQIVGFYSEVRAGRIKGGCNFIVNPETLAIIKENNYELPKDVYDDLFGEKRGKRKKGKELSLFYTDYIIEDSVGNTFLLAEEFYVTSTYVATGNGGGYWQQVFHYDDVLILKFNANGGLDWGRSIFKRSTVPSYNAFLKDDKLHVFLNSGKNLREKKDGRTKVSKGWFESTALYDIVYSKEGEVLYNKIQDNKGKTFYLPYYGTYNNGKFIMMSSGRKKKQFMQLE